MYLYDWKIATSGKDRCYKKQPIEPRKWVEQTGARAFIALKILKPDAVVENVELAKLEEINDLCLYDAGFNLANLVDAIFK
jgi:hypothetical protein